jgi:hypothetical protein
MQRVEQVLREHCAGNGVLTPIFNRGVTLVPMPRSAPLVAAAFWPAERICNAIVAAGLAARIAPVLTRTVAVPKSSRAPPGGRPLVSRHFETLSAQALLDMSKTIISLLPIGIQSKWSKKRGLSALAHGPMVPRSIAADNPISPAKLMA